MLGEDLIVQTLASKTDMDGTIQTFFDRHLVLLADRRRLSFDELIPCLVETHGEVVAHGTLCVAREDGVKPVLLFEHEGLVQVTRRGRLHDVTPVEPGEECLLQITVALFPRIDPRKPHLFDESVLECLKDSFNSSLGLWRVCRDILDLQTLHRSLELGAGLVVLHRHLLIHLVGAEFIEINGPGLAMNEQILLPEGKDGEDTFMFSKLGFCDDPRGVINGEEQADLSRATPVLEPMMIRAIELLHLSKAFFAGAP